MSGGEAASGSAPFPVAGRSNGLADPPLRGVRVLDLSRVLAGPFATQQLADLGASVIKVEDPRGGDSTRQWGPPFHDGGRSGYFLCCNRGKRSIAVDLGQPEGREVCRRLALASDVLIENFRAGQMTEWGLDLDDLRRANPRLVTCSISGFGADGPRALEGGYDALVQAMSGLMSITGPTDGPWSKTGVAVVDLAAGLFASTSIVALLHGRRPGSATARHVNVALFDCALNLLANVGAGFLLTERDAQRYGNAHPSIVPYEVFPAADGEFFLAVGTDRQWQALSRAVGRADWAVRPDWATNPGRVRDRAALIETLRADFSRYPRAELLAKLQAAGVPAGPLNSVRDALADPVVTERGLVQTHSDGTRSVRSPHVVAGLPELAPAPRLGEHSAEILTELGYPPGQQERLLRAGAVVVESGD